jgi:NitT/TauT family transport system ATP-binding protein
MVMTAAPGTVKRVYDIDLPRPRQVPEIRFDPDFVALYEEIWNTLRDEVQRAYARMAGAPVAAAA